MAGVSPIMMAGMGASVVGSASEIANSRAQSAGAGQVYQNRVDEINAKLAAAERKRQQSHDRVAAQQRARFAAQGLSPAEGSSAAVLKGLKSLSEAEAEERARQTELSRQRISLSHADAINANLLTRKSDLFRDNLEKLLTWD